VATTLAVVTMIGVVAVLQSGAGTHPPPVVAAPRPPPVAPRWVVDPSTTAQVSDVVGPQAAGGDTEARFGVAGADLGHMFTVGGRLAIAFGDTYGGPPAPQFFHAPRPDWRSNVLGWIDPPSSPRDGFALRDMVIDRPGHAAELLHSRKQDGVEWTVIPTYGIADGGRMLLHYMSVRNDFTDTRPGHWALNDAGVAVSDDGGRTWTRPPGAVWPGNTRFGQVAYVRPGGGDDPVAPDPPRAPDVPRLPTSFGSVLPNRYPTTFPNRPDGTVYVYGIPGGRFGDVSLAAVPPGKLLDRSAYRYWTGTGWSTSEDAAAPVVRGPVGELSVRWNSYYRTWMMMYLVETTGELVVRTSPSATGPWGDAQVVTTTREHPEAYAPYLTPRWTDGPDIWFTMSTYGDYRVSLMHARLRPAPRPS
jgi:hypothetical protein